MTPRSASPRLAPALALALACGGDDGPTGTASATSAGSTEASAATTVATAAMSATGPETATSDATATASTTSSSTTAAATNTTADTTTAGDTSPVLLTITLHLENSTFDAAYFAALDDFAATFEAHGGRLTLEPRDSVVKAAAGPPMLLDWKALEARGHAVGSHAAIGGVDPIPLDMFTAQAKMRHDQLAPRVTRLDHVSGNCGDVDWVKGVVDAGFRATTATTVLCLYSMDPADRPDPYKSLDCVGPTDPLCHQPFPSDLSARIHPWRARSGADWLSDDPAGELVIFPGSGSLPCLAEEAENPGDTLPSCTFAADDAALALADLDAAIAAADPNLVNTFYWVWGSWSLTPAEAPALEAFLVEIDARVAAGDVAWSNVGAMLDAYDAWLRANP